MGGNIKIKTLSSVVSNLPDGAHIALPGFAITRNAIAFAQELIRQGKKNLTISQCIAGMDTELLVGAGAVSRIIYSTGSFDRFGPLSNINRGISAGSLIAEEYSGLSITLRYLAGSLGISYVPCNVLLGTDLLRNLLEQTPDQVKETTCPFTGEKQVLLRALNPQVGVIVANYADSDGNAVITGPCWDLKEMAHASQQIIVLAEKIVSQEMIRNNPEKTVIPGTIVDTVVELPYAAYPTSVYQCYDYDAEHLKKFIAAARTPEGMKEYLDEYVFGTSSHEEYLEKFGIKRLLGLAADPYKGY